MTDLLFLKCHRIELEVMLPAFLGLISCPFDSGNMSVLLTNGFGTEKARAVAGTHRGPAGKAVNAQGLGLERLQGRRTRRGCRSASQWVSTQISVRQDGSKLDFAL